MAKVFIVNKSSHDFSAAQSYGDLVYLSEGSMSRYSTNNMIRQFSERMEGSKPSDHIVLCSLNVMNAVAVGIFAFKHGTINLLLYKNGKYIERNHVLET